MLVDMKIVVFEIFTNARIIYSISVLLTNARFLQIQRVVVVGSCKCKLLANVKIVLRISSMRKQRFSKSSCKHTDHINEMFVNIRSYGFKTP